MECQVKIRGSPRAFSLAPGRICAIIGTMKTTFYRAEHAAALKRKNRIAKALLALVAAGAAGLIALFCLRTNTLNAPRMELYATLTLLLAGWIDITLSVAVLRYDRALCGHIERILASQEEGRWIRGRVTAEKKRVSIPGSIEVRRLRIETAEGAERAYVCTRYASELDKALAETDDGGERTLLLIQGFAAGVER